MAAEQRAEDLAEERMQKRAAMQQESGIEVSGTSGTSGSDRFADLRREHQEMGTQRKDRRGQKKERRERALEQPQEEEDEPEFDDADVDVAKFLAKSESRDVYDVEAYDEELGVQLSELSEADERLARMFMPAEFGGQGVSASTQAGKEDDPQAGMTLGEIIMQKLEAAELAAAMTGGEISQNDAVEHALERRLDPKVLEVYRGVGQVLRRYRAGRLPKAFKIIPALSNWEEILWMTDPTTWSKQSVHQATRLFASNLNPRMAQRFYNHVLLPCVRADIADNRKLNFHLYLALKKSMYKPGAFFKGILLPLAEGGDCTLREALIIASVVAKVHVPPLHSSAAMLRLAELPYAGPASVFLTTLLDKKYALPFRVVDAIVDYFLRFRSDRYLPDGAELPLLWHKCMLSFAQRYKSDLLPLQKEHLQNLLRLRHHHYFSEEVRRELVNSTCRGEKGGAGAGGVILVRDQQTEDDLMGLM